MKILHSCRLIASAGAALTIGAETVFGAPGAQDHAAAEDQPPAEAERYRYLYRIALAQREWESNHVARAETLLDECGPELRGWEWHYLKRLCHPELFSLDGHGEGAWGVSFSQDGRWIASTGWQVAKLWDARTGEELRTFDGHRGWVTGVVFSPDGSEICSGGFGDIKIWDPVSGEERLSIDAHSSLIQGLAYDPDGSRIVSASGSHHPQRGDAGKIKVWDAKTGEKLLTIEAEQRVNAVAFSPNGRLLASGSGNLATLAPARPGGLKIWDPETGEEVADLPGHDFWITDVAFSPDGRRLASASADKTVKIWDVESGREIRTLYGHRDWVRRVAFSPDGRTIASSGQDSSTRLWDARTGRLLEVLRGQAGNIKGLAFSPNGERLATASERRVRRKGAAPKRTGEVKVWKISGAQGGAVFQEHANRVTDLAFSPDGKWLASCSETYSSANPGALIVRDASTGEVIHTFPGRLMGFTAVAFSPDSQVIVALGRSGLMQWDVITGRELVTFRIRVHPVHGLAVSPDGNLIATGGATIWDAITGEQLLETKGHRIRGHVTGLAFSPDSIRLASAGWGGNLGTEVNGKRKTIQTPNEVKISDAKTGEDLLTLDGGGHGVAYTPDGSVIASGDRDGSINIWNTETGELLASLRGHSGLANRVAFSPDGRRLASGGSDQTVRIWDWRTGLEALRLQGHTETISALAFSPDGRRLASSSYDGTVRVWDAGHSATQ